jgi:hypothetical protein
MGKIVSAIFKIYPSSLLESTFFFRATYNKIMPMTKDIITQVGNSGIEGEGAKLGEDRTELDEELGEALGVSKGSFTIASEILTGVRSGYLSIASTMYVFTVVEFIAHSIPMVYAVSPIPELPISVALGYLLV